MDSWIGFWLWGAFHTTVHVLGAKPLKNMLITYKLFTIGVQYILDVWRILGRGQI